MAGTRSELLSRLNRAICKGDKADKAEALRVLELLIPGGESDHE